MPETTEGYEPPFNTQFSVFLPNKVGMLMQLVDIFDGRDLRLVALSVVDSADHAVVRMVTSSADMARKRLKSHAFAFAEADIIVVELGADQRIGMLCKTLLSAEINIHYAYPLMVRPHGAPTIALHTDDLVFAGQTLRRHHFTILGEAELTDSTGGANPFDQPDN